MYEDISSRNGSRQNIKIHKKKQEVRGKDSHIPHTFPINHSREKREFLVINEGEGISHIIFVYNSPLFYPILYPCLSCIYPILTLDGKKHVMSFKIQTSPLHCIKIVQPLTVTVYQQSNTTNKQTVANDVL